MWELLALTAILFACYSIPRRINKAAAKRAETEQLRANSIRRARERAAERSYARIETHVDWECNGQ